MTARRINDVYDVVARMMSVLERVAKFDRNLLPELREIKGELLKLRLGADERTSGGETWFGFQCLNHDCVFTNGVVLDVRVNGAPDAPPNIACPICAKPMSFSAKWKSDANGYGSRGDVLAAEERESDGLGDGMQA